MSGWCCVGGLVLLEVETGGGEEVRLVDFFSFAVFAILVT